MCYYYNRNAVKTLFPKNLRSGFTIIELMTFVGIFAIAALFLVGILTTVTRTQLRQASGNEVAGQVTFVANTIQRLVRESSLIVNEPAGVASTTLILRKSSSTVDTTKIYADASMNAIYLQEIDQNGTTSTTVPLTDGKVKVGAFQVTKYQTPGGLATVQVDITLDANTANPKAKASRSWRGAITRVSAATFDSALLPTTNGTLNIGATGQRWNFGYFERDLTIQNGILNVGNVASVPSGMRIVSAGDMGFSSSSYGVILKSPSGSCWRVGISNVGQLTTTSATCAQ